MPLKFDKKEEELLVKLMREIPKLTKVSVPCISREFIFLLKYQMHHLSKITLEIDFQNHSLLSWADIEDLISFQDRRIKIAWNNLPPDHEKYT